ncbi:imidazolonepropionase [Apibacter raozihei]|uniref:imidazolonepropionase n=1 Tax=Apibacter raozihei TaxID=2500547 RepID=UPI000FE39627|nr:imidazolonepropionase [Apibacter raozihei]
MFKIKKGDIVWQNARIVTLDDSVETEYNILQNFDLIVRDNKIEALVEEGQVDYPEYINKIDAENGLLIPGFIDCHTHLVFGGDRAKEWEMRLNGVPYVEIAQKGGGINSTVKATRISDENTLYKLAEERLNALILEGVTTLESKSGYGLDLINERKQLKVSKKLGLNHPVEIVNTLLSAHTVPPEYKDKSDEYMELICSVILPTLWKEGLFEAVDVFCENVGFTYAQTKKLFECATTMDIPVKGHVDQLSNLGGSGLVAEFNGLSVDHIEYLDEENIKKLSRSRTVATVLPLAYYFLREKQKPPIDLLRKYKIPIAVSTDLNPGTSPFASLRLAMNAACVQFGLTPKEALLGVTKNAAKALKRENTHGQIKKGYMADFCIWNVKNPVEIFYELGRNPLKYRIFQGNITHKF